MRKQRIDAVISERTIPGSSCATLLNMEDSPCTLFQMCASFRSTAVGSALSTSFFRDEPAAQRSDVRRPQRAQGTHNVAAVYDRSAAGFGSYRRVAMECATDLRRLPHSTAEIFFSRCNRSSTGRRLTAHAIFFQLTLFLEMAFGNGKSG